jgi:hypothetical protein
VRWRDRVELTAEIGRRGVAAGDMVWDGSDWDDPASTWAGVEPDFERLEGAAIERLRVSRGRRTGLERNAAGTAELGLVWRDARGGRWSLRGSSPVKVGAELRIRASVDGGRPIPIYRGAVRRVRDGWSPGRREFRITAQLVDRLADLAAVDLPAIAAAGADETGDQRVLRVMGYAGVDPFYSSMGTGADDSGVVPLQASTFSRNMLEEAIAAVDAGAGDDLLCDREGRLVYRRARWWLPVFGAHPRWNSTLVAWGNVVGVSLPHPFRATGFGSGQDLDDVRNVVSMARAGGSAITVDDAASIARYGQRTFQRMDLVARDDSDVADAADLRLEQSANRTDRIEAIAAELEPDRDAADLEAFVDVELGDQHRVRWDDGDGELTGTFHVLGIRLAVDPRHWRLELDLWAFAGFGMQTPGVWSESLWGTGLWT